MKTTEHRVQDHTRDKKKPNIMLVITEITGAGAELVVANLCKHLDRSKYNVTVCHLKTRGERGEELYKLGYDVVGLQDVDPTKPNYTSALKLRSLAASKRIDLLHSHNLHPLIDCSHCKLLLPRIKLLHTFHYGNYPNLPMRYLLLEGFSARIANQLVAVGYNQKKKIAATYKINPNRIQTVYNGVEHIRNPNAEKLPIKNASVGPLVVGTICTFIEQKGLEYLLKAAAEIKRRGHKVKFIVAGDGPLKTRLEKQKNEMGLDSIVEFLGWVPMAANTILPKIDIFLQTSLWEAMSMVILEAMAAEKPIIATNVGENKRIVDPEKAGLIVPPADVSAIVKSLETLIKNPKLIKIMGENGRKAFAGKYTVELMARRYENIYHDILKRSKKE